MGNGGVLPDELQGKLVIVPALNKMFGSELQTTKTKIRLLKQNFFPNLGDHADHDKGNNRRQRTLRHLAWLLTGEMLDIYPYPNDRFRLWLRYLTWIEHIETFGATYKVTLNGAPSNLKPARVIKQTIKLALQNDTKIVFDWDKAPAGYDLTVDVKQNATPMTITVNSIKGEDVPTNIETDIDDKFIET